jgi:hypothetical protein
MAVRWIIFLAGMFLGIVIQLFICIPRGETMNDINRELAELLGLCWHEYDHWEGRKQVCRCGKEL